MEKTIPYFYTDLIARIVPGVLLIALVSITSLPIPKPWVSLVTSEGPGKLVMVPILFAGLVYVLGTVLEALLSNFFNKLNSLVFECSLKKKYIALSQESDPAKKKLRSANELSILSYGHLITSVKDIEKQAVPHIMRFQSEGKMCFSSMIILAGFLLLGIADKCFDIQLIKKDLDIADIWLFIIFIMILALLRSTYQKLKDRAFFIAKTIERSAAEHGDDDVTKNLQNELLAFRKESKLPAFCKKNNETS